LPFEQELFQQESHHGWLALRRWTNRNFAARRIRTAAVKDMSAEVDNGKIVKYRISAKLTFKLE
jgi:hypothetical protein